MFIQASHPGVHWAAPSLVLFWASLLAVCSVWHCSKTITKGITLSCWFYCFCLYQILSWHTRRAYLLCAIAFCVHSKNNFCVYIFAYSSSHRKWVDRIEVESGNMHSIKNQLFLKYVRNHTRLTAQVEEMYGWKGHEVVLLYRTSYCPWEWRSR